MRFGMWELLLIRIIVVVVFGVGKLPRVMGDMGKGVRAMREGLKGEEETEKTETEDKKS